MTIIDAVRRTIRTYGLLPAGSRVAVALSGGGDSVALLLALCELAPDEGFHVVGAAHLNHLLRGPDADADADFCRDLAARLAVPFDAERVDIAAVARETGNSIELAAHVVRYAFFERTASRLGAAAVAVAHTKNDQAETFLLRLLRGAGPRGLSGIHPRSGFVVRPLIETSREDVRKYLSAGGIAFREDASNADLAIPRNRIRHELLPLLETRFTHGVINVLDRAAAIAREDADYLEDVARAAAPRFISQTARGIELDVDALLGESPAIVRRVIRLAQQMAAGPDCFIGFDAGEAVRRLAVSKSRGQLDLPGHSVNRRGGVLVLIQSAGRERPVPVADFAYRLDVPGQVAVPEAACAISADSKSVPFGRSAADMWHLSGRSDEAVIEARRLTGPLEVRNRRKGDRFRPLGLKGHKALQDFFVDAKIDRLEREITPVIVDATGQIVWIAGHALGEDFRVTRATTDVVILKRLPI